MFTSKLGTADSRLANIKFSGSGLPDNIYNRDFSDNITLGESLTVYNTKVSFSDTLTLSDNFVRQTVLNLTLSDTVTFTEFLTGPILDSLTFTDSFTFVKYKVGSATDSITLSDSFTAEQILQPTFSDVVVLAETLTRTVVRARSLSDTITLTDTFSAAKVERFSDTLTFSETWTTQRIRRFNDLLEFNESMTPQTVLTRLTADVVSYSESLSRTSVFRRTLSDTLTLNETMVGFAVRPLVPETLPLSDSIIGVRAKPLFDTLTVTDGFTFNKVVRFTINESVILTETVTRQHIANVVCSDTLVPLDTIDGTRVKFATFSDSITLVEELLRQRYIRLIDDTLSLSETWTGQKIGIRTASDTMTITDATVLAANFKRELPDEVVIADGFIVRAIRQPGNPRTPNPGTRPVTPPGGGYVPSQIVEGVIEVVPVVLMEGFYSSIVLPPPEFNDFEAYDNKISVQRSMTGSYFTYKKTSDRLRHSWRFIIPKPKADELRAFIEREADQLLRVTDWNGNVWNFNILLDSIDFTEIRRWGPCGNANDVTLEFLGTRYA